MAATLSVQPTMLALSVDTLRAFVTDLQRAHPAAGARVEHAAMIVLFRRVERAARGFGCERAGLPLGERRQARPLGRIRAARDVPIPLGQRERTAQAVDQDTALGVLHYCGQDLQDDASMADAGIGQG